MHPNQPSHKHCEINLTNYGLDVGQRPGCWCYGSNITVSQSRHGDKAEINKFVEIQVLLNSHIDPDRKRARSKKLQRNIGKCPRHAQQQIDAYGLIDRIDGDAVSISKNILENDGRYIYEECERQQAVC